MLYACFKLSLFENQSCGTLTPLRTCRICAAFGDCVDIGTFDTFETFDNFRPLFWLKSDPRFKGFKRAKLDGSCIENTSKKIIISECVYKLVFHKTS